jgi:hypothetical protein
MDMRSSSDAWTRRAPLRALQRVLLVVLAAAPRVVVAGVTVAAAPAVTLAQAVAVQLI